MDRDPQMAAPPIDDVDRLRGVGMAGSSGAEARQATRLIRIEELPLLCAVRVPAAPEQISLVVGRLAGHIILVGTSKVIRTPIREAARIGMEWTDAAGVIRDDGLRPAPDGWHSFEVPI